MLYIFAFCVLNGSVYLSKKNFIVIIKRLQQSRREHNMSRIERKKFKKQNSFLDAGDIKVAFMGAEASGKSSIVQRLVRGIFFDDYQPTVFEFYSYETTFNSTWRVRLQISDTAGSFSFPAMDRLTIQKSDVVVVVFDLTSLSSLKRAEEFFKIIKNENPNKSILLVGNKSDLPHRVACKMSLEQRLSFSNQHSYIETSVKFNENAGHDVIKMIVEEFALSKGPGVTQSQKPLSVKLLKKFAESTENLLDLF